MDKPLMRYFVQMTWEEERLGCYEGVFQATSYQDAEDKCRAEMAALKAMDQEPAEDGEDDLNDPDWWLDNYGGLWRTLNCREVEEFIAGLRVAVEAATSKPAEEPIVREYTVPVTRVTREEIRVPVRATSFDEAMAKGKAAAANYEPEEWELCDCQYSVDINEVLL